MQGGLVASAQRSALPSIEPPTQGANVASLSGLQDMAAHLGNELRTAQAATPLTHQPHHPQPYPTFPDTHTNLPFAGRGKISSNFGGGGTTSLTHSLLPPVLTAFL